MRKRKTFVKRMMASLLAAVMVVTSAPQTVFADEVITEESFAEASQPVEDEKTELAEEETEEATEIEESESAEEETEEVTVIEVTESSEEAEEVTIVEETESSLSAAEEILDPDEEETENVEENPAYAIPDEEYTYSVPFMESDSVLLWGTEWVVGSNSFTVYRNGVCIEDITLTYVRITDTQNVNGSADSVISLSYGDDTGEWIITAIGSGLTTLEYTLNIEGTEHTVTGTIQSTDLIEKWELLYDYENDDHTVLVGEEKRITTDTYHQMTYIGSDDQLTEWAGNESLYSIAIAKDEEGNELYDKDKIEVCVAEDQKTILVEGKARGGTTFTVALMVPTDPGDENSEKKEVLRQTFYVVVSNDYTYIAPQPSDMPEFVPGEATVFTPQLMHVYADNDGKAIREACENTRVTLSWDENNLGITYKNDAGVVTELSSGEACTAAEYTITRKTDSDTYLTVNMEWNRNGFGYDPYGTKTYEIDRYVAPNYTMTYESSGSVFAGSYSVRGDAESPSWIYTDETDFKAFYNLNQITEIKDYSLNIQIGDYAEDGNFTEIVEDPAGKGIICTEFYDSTLLVSVNGKKLVDDGYLSMSGNNHFWLRVQAVKPGAEDQTVTIAEAAAEVNLREPSVFYGLDCNEQNILKGWNWEYPTYFYSNIETAANPFGGDWYTEVRNVQIIDSDNDEEDVLIIGDTDYERGCGYIQANAFGTATVEFTVYIDALDIETTLTKIFHVTDEVWSFETRYQNNTDQMIQNSEKKIETALKRVYFEEMEWGGSEERWEDTECKLKVKSGSYNSDLINVTIDTDGTTILVTSGEETGESDLEVVIKVKNESGKWVEAAREKLHICVTSEYYFITPFDYEFEMIYPGDSKEVELQLLHAYTDIFGESHVEQCEEVQYTWDWDQEWDWDLWELIDHIKVSYVNDDDMEVDLELPNSPGYWDLNCSYANKYTITRNDNTNTGIRISAALYNGSDYEQVADINYQLNTFNAPRVDIQVEDICQYIDAEGDNRKPRQNENGDTWIYTGGDFFYAVFDIEQLKTECGDVDWIFELGDYTGDEGSFEVIMNSADTGDIIEVEEKDNKLIVSLQGDSLEQLLGNNEETWIRFKATAQKQYGSDTYTVAERDFGISVRKQSIWIDVNTDTEYMLPGWEYEIWPDISIEFNTPKYPNHERFDARIIDVSVYEGSNEDPNEVVEVVDNGDHWTVIAKGSGYVELVYSVVCDEVSYRNDVSKYIYVSDNIWNLDLNYENGTDHMTEFDGITIDTSLHHGYKSEDGSDVWDEPEYVLEVVSTNDNADKYYVVVFGNTKLYVTSQDPGEDLDIEVAIKVKNEAGDFVECARKTIHIQLCNDFYYLETNAGEAGELEPGESMDVSVTLYHVYRDEDEGKQVKACEDARFRWEWDRDGDTNVDPVYISYQNAAGEMVTLTADANTSTADEYTFTRIIDRDMYFRIVAEVPDGGEYREVFIKDEHMEEFRAPYYDISIDDVCKDSSAEGDAKGSRRNEYGDTWIYSDETNLCVVVNVEQLKTECEDFEFVYEIGDYTESGFETYLSDEPVGEPIIVQETDDKLIIQLNGTKLADQIRQIDAERNWVRLKVSARKQYGSYSYEISSTDIGISIRDPYEVYSWTRDYPGGNELKPGEWLNIYPTDVHFVSEDAEHPYGSDVVLSVENVSIDDAKNVNSNGERIISLTHSEEFADRWQINGLHYGCAAIRIVAKDESGVETTIERDIYVTGCTMRPTASVSEDGIYELNLVNPNGKDLVYYVTRYTWDENGEQVYDRELFRGSTMNNVSTTISGQNPMQMSTDWQYEVTILVNDFDFSDISYDFEKLIPKAAAAATCTKTGNIAYEYVQESGNIYVQDEDGNYVKTTLEAVTIPAAGHKVVKDAAVAATYISTGKTEGSHCSVCKKVLTAQKTVAMKTLAKPVISSAVNASTGTKVSWGKVTGATGYEVYRGSTKIATVTTTSYADTKANTSGTTYSYKVYAIAKNSDGKIVNRSAVSSTKKIRRLSATSVTLENGSTGVKVTWKKVTGANGYYVYRGSTRVATISSGSTVTYVDKAAKTNGTKYTYKVYAFYKTTTGTVMKSVASASKSCYFLSRPTISGVDNYKSKAMKVTWSKNSKATGYQIKYVTGTTTKTITISGASTVTKNIGSLTKGNTYKVYVRAYKTVSGVKYYSDWSSAKSLKISK